MKKLIPMILVLLLMICTVGISQADEVPNPETLKSLLSEEFYVQQGVYRELDTVKEASAGRLLSCFGNNAGSAYVVFSLPAAPDQDTSLGSEQLGWPDEIATEYDHPEVENAPANPYFAPGGWEYKLRQDEVIVLITPLPGECKYYSFINYVMFTEHKPGRNYEGVAGMFTVGNEETGLYHPIFGSIGDSVNMTNIRHSGDSAFDTTAVIVIGANRDSVDTVVAKLNEAGYDDGMINIMTTPAATYKMGLQKGADTFSFLQRVSQATDGEAYRDYLDHISERAALYRVTPITEKDPNPYANATVIPRGTGVHEAAVVENAEKKLETIREALIAAYGVNHTKTGKGLYANAVLYAKPMLNGVTSVYDSLLEGSAGAWLGEAADGADAYYVYKLARKAADDYTAVIPYSTGNEQGKYYGVDNGNPVLVAFRSYLDETGTGASYYEVIYDRVIVFHRKR